MSKVVLFAPILTSQRVLWGGKGGCPNPPWPNGWSTWPADFTAMLEYNYSTNIGVTAWVFDDLTDEIGSVITKLGSPNPYTRSEPTAA